MKRFGKPCERLKTFLRNWTWWQMVRFDVWFLSDVNKYFFAIEIKLMFTSRAGKGKSKRKKSLELRKKKLNKCRKGEWICLQIARQRLQRFAYPGADPRLPRRPQNLHSGTDERKTPQIRLITDSRELPPSRRISRQREGRNRSQHSFVFD